MRHIPAATALVLAVAPAIAAAQQVDSRATATMPLGMADGPYVGGSLGYLVAEDADITPGGDIGRDDGYAVNLAFGQKYERFRAEAELGWKLTDAKPRGDIGAASLMVNAYWDIATGSRFTPYLGGGVGMAYVDIDGPSTPLAGTIDDDDLVLAWQLMAGVSYTLSDKMDLYGGYRFFDIGDADIETRFGDFEMEDLRSHIVEVGLRYRL